MRNNVNCSAEKIYYYALQHYVKLKRKRITKEIMASARLSVFPTLSPILTEVVLKFAEYRTLQTIIDVISFQTLPIHPDRGPIYVYCKCYITMALF